MKKILTLLLAGVLLTALCACGGKDGSSGDGYAEGFLGDTLSTYWFDFVVEDAYACQSYGGYTAAVGNQLVVACLSLENTQRYSLDMWYGDFPLVWGSGDDEIAYPLSAATGQQLPDEYSLAIREARSGLLVYEVPAGIQDFTMVFVEYFEDGTEEGAEGDAYFVYFTAKDDEMAGI